MCLATISSGLEIFQANKMAEASAKAANQAAVLDYSIMEQRRQQLSQDASIEATERQRQGLRERSKILVAAGEAGVLGGTSPLRELNTSLINQGYDQSIIGVNLRNQLSDTVVQDRGIAAQNKSRINQAKSSSYSPFTSMLKIGTSIGEDVLTGYTTRAKIKG